MALSKTGRFLSKAEILGMGVFPPFQRKTLEIKGFLGLERPYVDLVSHTPRPRGRGRPWFAGIRLPFRKKGRR